MAESKMGSAPPLSEEEIQEMLNSEGIAGDLEFLGDIIEMAAKSTVERVAGIEAAVSRNDAEGVWRLAHAIKSTCLMSNMVQFGRAAIGVERAFRNPEGNDIENRPMLLKELFHQADRLLATHESFRNHK